MNNTKPKDNVVKIGHNSNRSISQETLEKMANRFMHILEYVNNNLETLEKRMNDVKDIIIKALHEFELKEINKTHKS